MRDTGCRQIEPAAGIQRPNSNISFAALSSSATMTVIKIIRYLSTIARRKIQRGGRRSLEPALKFLKKSSESFYAKAITVLIRVRPFSFRPHRTNAHEGGPGDRLSSTVKDLVAGSGTSFAERGAFALKENLGEWRLFAVER
jgi:hypothetical protein